MAVIQNHAIRHAVVLAASGGVVRNFCFTGIQEFWFAACFHDRFIHSYIFISQGEVS